MTEQQYTAEEMSQRIREAMEAARTDAAHDGPWTVEEEHVLTATVANTRKLDIGKVQAYAEAYAPTALAGRTRMDQLHAEAIRRELAERDQLAAKSLEWLREHVPTFTAHGFAPHFDYVMDRGHAAIRVYRVPLAELETVLKDTMTRAHVVTEHAGKSIPRDLRGHLFQYTHVLRGRIRDAQKAARTA